MPSCFLHWHPSPANSPVDEDRISEHGPDRGARGGGSVRGGGAGARAARRLPPVCRQLRTQAQDTRVVQVGLDYTGKEKPNLPKS